MRTRFGPDIQKLFNGFPVNIIHFRVEWCSTVRKQPPKTTSTSRLTSYIPGQFFILILNINHRQQNDDLNRVLLPRRIVSVSSVHTSEGLTSDFSLGGNDVDIER